MSTTATDLQAIAWRLLHVESLVEVGAIAAELRALVADLPATPVIRAEVWRYDKLLTTSVAPLSEGGGLHLNLSRLEGPIEVTDVKVLW